MCLLTLMEIQPCAKCIQCGGQKATYLGLQQSRDDKNRKWMYSLCEVEITLQK